MDLITLKDGTKVPDICLGRLQQFDDRSRNFSVEQILQHRRIRSYTWRCHYHFDQGAHGSCVGMSIGHELAARPAEIKRLTHKFLFEKIYWEAQKIDPWNGGSYPGAQPYYEGTSLLAGVKIAHKLGYFRNYYWAFNFNHFLSALGHRGPALIGIPWLEGMYNPDSNGVIRATGRSLGGHAIIARAINVRTGMITLRNSWGKRWGHNGDCYISFDDLEKLLGMRGEACFMEFRTTKNNPHL